MIRLVDILREHRQFFIVITLLTLITTFPTIVYVFNTDVFWHPAGEHRDVPFWDIWYGKQFLTGQASAFYTNQIFYPEGVSLRFHLFFIPHIIVVNALSILLPISNAYSLAYLLIIFLCALSAYVYLSWLFKDKWIALLGAVVFGLSPHVVGHPFQPQIACIATIPLATYYFHRGIVENRRAHVLVAGLLTGLTTIIVFYSYVCLLILLGFVALALAVARYREKRFWLNVALLILTISLSSLWRVYHLVTGSESLGEVAMWHGDEELGTAVESYFVNYANPWFGEKLESILGIFSRFRSSASSYLGYLPLLLIGIGLMKPGTRRKMAPWAGLCALFLILRLGSHVNVSGVIHYNIPLPKLYLNQLLPEVFVSFWEADFFMAGALLPLAVLTCYGLVALRKQFAVMAKPGIVLALIAIVALEYHIPVESERIFPEGDGTFSWERLAFLDWLEEEEGDIRLINLPMGRRNAKVYGLYQALSGYPHATGAISRTPDSAFDYIRGNLLLNTWNEKQTIDCMTVDRGAFVSGLAQLEADGFSHVVVHNEFKYWDRIKDSFRELEPAYADDYVWIYRLHDLGDSCNEEGTAHHSFASAYTDFLETNSRLDDSQGAAVVFTPTVRTADYFLRYLRYFTGVDRSVLTITGDDEATIKYKVPTPEQQTPSRSWKRRLRYGWSICHKFMTRN